MALEAATFISQLVATNPIAGDPKSEGDDHLRLIKAALQAQFPNLGAVAATPTAAELNFVDGVTSAIQTQLDAKAASAATTASLALKANLANPAFTGTVEVPTPTLATHAATKAYADALSFAAGSVASVSGTAPVVSSGGATPAISMAAATASVAGHLTAANWTTFNGKQDALVSATNIKTVNSTTLLGSGDLVTGDVTLTGSQTLTNKTLSSPVLNTPTGNVVTSVNGDIGAVTVDAAPAWAAF